MVEMLDVANRRSPALLMNGGARVPLVPGDEPRGSGAAIASMLDTQNIVRALTHDMASEPPVNIARVEQLKAEIAAGTYKIDPQRIADAMIEQEVLARKG